MSDAYPPDYVNVPARLIYDKRISPALRDTYCQIRGLAWKTGYKTTPAYSIDQLAEMFGKSKSVLYEHVHALRRSGWLLFSQPQSVGYYVFSFSEPPESVSSLSGNSEHALLSTTATDNQQVNPNSNLRTGASGNSENDERKRDPTLDHEAVRIYRRLTHITANPVQRDNMVLYVSEYPLWEATIKHWLGHGWSKMNVSGMIDSYKKRGVEGCNLCQRAKTNGNGHKPAESSEDIARRLIAKRRAEREGQN